MGLGIICVNCTILHNYASMNLMLVPLLTLFAVVCVCVCVCSTGHKPQQPGTNSAIHVLPPPSPPYAPLLSPNVLRRLESSPGTLGGGQVQQLVSPPFPVSKWDFRTLVL